MVGELDDQPVALANLSQLGPGEDWFHGLRVDPTQRGKGFARAMLRRCAELSRERGARTLRYLTDEDNPTMHRVADDQGFALAYAPLWYHAPARLGAPRAVALPPEQFPSLMDDLARSELLAQCGGMYFLDWRNLNLTAARLRAHLERGEVLALPRALSADEGDERAWAIVVPRHEGGFWLAHIEGPPEQVGRLGAAISMAAEPAEEYARALLPPDAGCIPALRAAGFEPTTYLMRVYELRPSEGDD
jgi:hypothetical protein